MVCIIVIYHATKPIFRKHYNKAIGYCYLHGYWGWKCNTNVTSDNIRIGQCVFFYNMMITVQPEEKNKASSVLDTIIQLRDCI